MPVTYIMLMDRRHTHGADAMNYLIILAYAVASFALVFGFGYLGNM